MADYYVDSVSGSDTSPFDTWAKASNDLEAALVLASAGEVIYVASDHTDTTAGALVLRRYADT